MTWKGALYGRDDETALKGYRQVRQRWGLPMGLDGPFQVCYRLLDVKVFLNKISGAVGLPGDQSHEQVVGPVRNLSDGGGNTVWDDLQEGLLSVHRHEGDPVGVHDTQPTVLHGCNLVGGGVKVPGVDRGEKSDVHLELRPIFPPERNF